MAFCPNLSSPQVKKDFGKLEKVLGPNIAHAIWNRNNGNPIDQDPNGESSILYRQLYDLYRDEDAAIRAKANIYTERYLSTNNWLPSGQEPVFDNIEKEPDLTPKPLEEEKLEKEPILGEEEADEETIPEELKRQADVLKASLPFVQEVIYDRELKIIGELEAGGTIIRINPDKMKEDTLAHEYGHLLIDLMGGMSNKFIREGRKQLIGSVAEVTVKEKYPDLEDTEKFDKEVVATAIGMEAAIIFSEKEPSTKFAKWLLRMFRKLKELTGISRNNAQILARKLTEGKEIDTRKLSGKPSDYAQEMREDISSMPNEQIVEAVSDWGNHFRLSKDEKNYLFSETGTLFKADTTVEHDRTSTILSKEGLSMTEEEGGSEAVQEWTPVGTFAHQLAEDAMNGVFTVTQTDPDISITKDAHIKFIQLIQETFKDYHVKAEVLTGDPAIRVAGTMDVFGIHKVTGEKVIFDYKTKRKYKIDKATGLKTEGGFKFYNVPFANKPYSQLEKNAAQLGLYKKMLFKTLGVKVDKVFVVPLVVDIEEVGTRKVIKSIEIDSTTYDGMILMPPMPQISDIYKKLALATNIREELENEDVEINEEYIQERVQKLENIEKAKKLQDPISRKRIKAVKIVLSKIQRGKATKKIGNIMDLSILLDKLLDEDVSNEDALMRFMYNAINEIESLHSRMKFLEEKEAAGDINAFTLEEVHNWYATLNAYSVLEDLDTYISTGELVGATEEEKEDLRYIKKKIKNTIVQRNEIRNKFSTKGAELLAKDLAPYLTLIKEEYIEKARKEWLKNNIVIQKTLKKKEWMKKLDEYLEEVMAREGEDIIKETKMRLAGEMLEASRGDIGVIERWLDSPINSNDPLVAAMSSKMATIMHKIRKRSLAHRNDLIDITRQLEKQFGYKLGDDVEKMYSFMLEHDSEGNATGSILSKFTSKLIQAKFRMLEATKTLPAKQRAAARNRWFTENMPTDNIAFTDAFTDFIKSLRQSDAITDAQEILIMHNYNSASTYYRESGIIPAFVNSEIKLWILNNKDYYTEPANKWKSKEYNNLLKILKDKNDPKSKFYNKIKSITSELDRKLPEDARLYSQLPFLLKNTAEKRASGDKLLNIVESKLKRTFQIQAEDKGRLAVQSELLTDESDNVIDLVPTYYKRNNRTYKPHLQSFDLGTLYSKWSNMAINYDEMSGLQPAIEATREYLRTREYAVLNQKGVRYKKAMDALGNLELARNSANSNILNQFDDYVKALVYGQALESLGTSNFEKLGFKVDRVKALQGISKVAAYSLLGLNLSQAINNVHFGEMSNIVEAFGGQFFDLADLHTSTTKYWANVMPLLDDIGSRKPDSFLGQLIEDFDPLSDPLQVEFRESRKYSQLMKSNTAFFMSHIGEHFMQSRVMLAMLHKITAYDKKGNVLGNMYDMYEKHWNATKDPNTGKGVYGLPKEVDLRQSAWTATEQAIFASKVRGVLAGIHGEFSQEGLIAIQRHVAGQMGLMFRKFVMPGLYKRYRGERWNQRLGTKTYGYYRVGGKFMGRLIADVAMFKFTEASNEWYTMDLNERAAVRRMAAEITFFLLMIGFSAFMVKLKGESPEDRDNLMVNLLHYTAVRSSKELLFFVYPPSAFELLRSPAASISVLENLGKLIWRLISGGMMEEYKQHNDLYDYKIAKDFLNTVPLVRQYYRLQTLSQTIELMGAK